MSLSLARPTGGRTDGLDGSATIFRESGEGKEAAMQKCYYWAIIPPLHPLLAGERREIKNSTPVFT